ncbi:MAG: hypothetical protein WKG00_10100 [Polyangiaceae bacterium]
MAVLLAPVGAISQRLCWAWLPLALELAVKLGCDLTFLLAERPSSR